MYMFNEVVLCTGQSGLEALFGVKQCLFEGRQEINLINIYSNVLSCFRKKLSLASDKLRHHLSGVVQHLLARNQIK